MSTDSGGGLVNISLLNGLGGSNILSPSIGGSALGLGAIWENDMAGNGSNGTLGAIFGNISGNTGDSSNSISSGGNADNVNSGDGGYVSAGSDSGLINVALLNGLGGSNILSPSIGGPSIGLGAIFENDTAGFGNNGLNGPFFANDGGGTGNSANDVSSGGDAGSVNGGDGGYLSSGAGGDAINVALLNGIGGSNILSPSVGGPSVGFGAIFENDAVNNGGHGIAGSGLNDEGADTGDSTNSISTGGDGGDVNAGSGAYIATGADGSIGGLISAALLNGVGGSTFLSPSVGGPSLGIGPVFENDTTGGNGHSLLGSLFGYDGGDTGESTNTISAGGDAGNTNTGDGTYVASGSDGGIGGLIKAALLNGAGGSNFLSPSIGGPSLGVGAIFENDIVGDAYDGHVPLAGLTDALPDIGAALDLITSAHQLFDLPSFDVTHVAGDLSN